jgi:hypothetical protein
MKKLFFISIIVVVSAITIGFFHTAANAEDVEYQIISYIVKADGLPIPDVDKHMLGLFERKGVAVFKDGENAVFHTYGTVDSIDGNGKAQGYSTYTFPDGSTIMVKWDADAAREPGKLMTYTGKGEYIKGTGRFQGIKGSETYKGIYITPYDKENKADAVVDVKASYTLPK